MIIGKWKSDINGGLRWKIIKGWPHQHFIVSAFNITLYKIIHGKNYEKLYKLLFKAHGKLIPKTYHKYLLKLMNTFHFY